MTTHVPSHPEAPCRLDPDWDGHSDWRTRREEAARLCEGCPIVKECLTAALARGERYGVWGGHDIESEYAASRVRPVEDDPDDRCGSDAGYKRHHRRHEAACRPCLDAHRRTNRPAVAVAS